MRYANQKEAVIDKPDVKGIQHMGLDFDTLSMALKSSEHPAAIIYIFI